MHSLFHKVFYSRSSRASRQDDTYLNKWLTRLLLSTSYCTYNHIKKISEERRLSKEEILMISHEKMSAPQRIIHGIIRMIVDDKYDVVLEKEVISGDNRYYIDVYIPKTKHAFECMGYKWHYTDAEKIDRDTKRMDDLLNSGHVDYISVIDAHSKNCNSISDRRVLIHLLFMNIYKEMNSNQKTKRLICRQLSYPEHRIKQDISAKLLKISTNNVGYEYK